MKYISSISLNIGLLALLYFGFIEGIEPCQNASVGLIMAMGALGCIMLLGQLMSVAPRASNHRPMWFRKLDMTFDIVSVGFMFAFGHPVAGAMLVVAMISCQSAMTPKEEKS